MPTIKVTDATGEPITLAEAKAHLRVTWSKEDALIEALITAARQEAEHQLRRTLLETTWKLVLDAFPACACIRLHNPKINAVEFVKYYDTAGVLQTLATSVYLLDGDSEPGRLCLAPSQSWPSTQDRVGAVQVQYTAGWASADDVPQVIKAWIKLRLGTLFEHREQIAAGVSIAEIPFVSGLLDPYRVWSL